MPVATRPPIMRARVLAFTAAMLVSFAMHASAHADTPGAANDPPHTEAPREIARIGIAGGAGYANEHTADDKGAYAAAAVNLAVFPWAGLSVALVGETLTAYGRHVPTTLPSPDGKGQLVLDVSERLPRMRQLVGYEVLHHVLRDNDRARLSPYIFDELTWFVNGPVPQRAFSVGGGVAAEVRVHDGLRLLCDLSYASRLALDHPAVQRLLALGTLQSSFRMVVGAAFAIGRTARFELRYQGDQLYFAHSTRILDTVLLGPVFHIR